MDGIPKPSIWHLRLETGSKYRKAEEKKKFLLPTTPFKIKITFILLKQKCKQNQIYPPVLFTMEVRKS